MNASNECTKGTLEPSRFNWSNWKTGDRGH